VWRDRQLRAVRRRRADEADLELLEEAHLAALGPIALVGYGWTKERLRAQFYSEVELARCEVIEAGLARGQARHVSWRDVGYISIEDRGVSWYIDSFAILPNYQRHGIGEAALRSVLEAAGPRPVRLSVLRTNRARSLYARMRFRTIGGDRLREHMEWRAAVSSP
jgi:ribosomal protein S18 acetylase RimI-like enzyme